MTARLLTFIRLLREHGVRISVAESLDALHSVRQVGIHDRELLRLGLRTALVKSHHDFATFDVLFERFFTTYRRRKRRQGQPQPSGSNGIPQRPTTPANGSRVQSPPQQPPQHPSPPATTAPGGDQQEAPDSANDRPTLQALATLTDLEHAWRRQLDSPLQRLPSASHQPGRQPAVVRLDRDFPPTQLADMYREVERLAARLLTRQALRYRRARHGRLDLRRTVRQGLRSGREIPFMLAYRRRHINKLRLIVLCDVSGSVWQVSTFLLQLVHTLQAAFTSVRSLVFVNSLVEVTELFRRMRFPQDLEALRQYPQLNLFGFSDFGRVFYQFYHDLLGDLRRDTALLILGDARTNHFDPQAWALGEIRQRCRRLIWLNPEPRRLWDTEDSVMDVYAPYCDAVLECWTLEHLAQAADLLLQR
jgi:uncharacterized protein with von Willebrand factor type A (vWA) domain